MTVQIGDIVRLTAKMAQGGDEIQNVFHVKNVGSGTVADATFLADAIDFLDLAYANLTSKQGDAFTYESVEAFNVTQGAPIGEDSWSTVTAGTDSTNQEYAKQVAALVRFPTATARSQGRKFLAGFTEGDFENGGVLSSAMLTALGSFATTILAGFTSDTQDFEAGNWNATLARFAPWISAITNVYNAIQRRRAAGVGS